MPCLSLPTRLLLFCSCALLLAPAAWPAAQTKGHKAPRQVRDQIADLEEQWKQATISGDTASMDRLLSDDYVGISWTGMVSTKAQQLDRARTRALTISRMDLSDVKVKVLGPVAIVTARADVVGTNDDAPINGAFRYTRVYQRQPGGTWKITNFESTREHTRNRNRAAATAAAVPDRSIPAPP